MTKFLIIAGLLAISTPDTWAQQDSSAPARVSGKRTRSGETVAAPKTPEAAPVKTENAPEKQASSEAAKVSGVKRTRSGETVAAPTTPQGDNLTPKTQPKASATAAKAYSGTVVTLLGASAGAQATLTPEVAKEAVTNGNLLGVMIGSGATAKLYAVVYADGRPASADLAQFAGASVTVTGKMEQRNGFNVLVADTIAATK